MGKQINYYMEYDAFLSISKCAIDLGCLIVTEDIETGKIISSSDISIVTQDTIRYYFYIPKAGPLKTEVRADGSEWVNTCYNETGNAIIEADYCRFDLNEGFIGRGRLFSQTGYYDQNGEFISRPKIVDDIYKQLVKKVKKAAPYTETSPGYKNYITPFLFALKMEYHLRLM